MHRRTFLGLSALAGAAVASPAAAFEIPLGRARANSERAPKTRGGNTLAARYGFRVQLVRTPGFAAGGVGALLYVPDTLDPRLPPPILVLLHGYFAQGGSRRALSLWNLDYGVLAAHAELAGEDPTEAKHRRALISCNEASNTPAAREAFSDMVLVCPVTPVPYLDRSWPETMDRYVEWLSTSLLPRVRERVPEGHAAAFGLAGVSMGGYVGFEVLTRRPDLFSTFTALQAAIKSKHAPRLAERLHQAFGQAPAPALQIITSDRDTYRLANQELFTALRNLGVDAELELDRGLHTRAWMRDVGSRAMLSWQDRALGRELDSRAETLLGTVAERCPCASTVAPQG